MASLYDVLVKKHNACPPDCRLCEEACAHRNEKVSDIVMKTIHIPELGFNGVISCIQCGDPRCLEICPTGAIVKSAEDGVVRIIEEKCVGCGMCTMACPYGGIYYDRERTKPLKCDNCNGNPVCVPACPYGVLEFHKNSKIQSYMKAEDLLSPGTRACAGCPAELAMRFALRILGQDTILFTAPGCMTIVALGYEDKATVATAVYPCVFTNVASTMTGVYRYYKHIERDVQLVAFVGDACSADISFQVISGAAERGERIIYIVYDNEACMNTGIQRTSTTPLGAWTNTDPVGEEFHGKSQVSKDIPMIMLAHNIPYVATATIAYLEDFAQKLTKAMRVKDGMSYIHLLSPCPTGWRAAPDMSIELSRLAVETNYFPLWEAESGQLRLTAEIPSPKPVKEYLKTMGRFAHLTEDDFSKIQELVDSKLDKIRHLALMSSQTARG